VFAAVSVQAQEILKWTGDSEVIRPAAKFVAASHFNSGIVRIAYLNDNFKKFFLGKTEVDLSPVAILSGYTAQQVTTDARVRGLLEDWAPLYLSHLWHLLAVQPNGERGFLLTDGNWNYFHIHGTDGQVWILTVNWENGWNVRAVSHLGPMVVHLGSKVISR
jgi:hypothetical protein